MIIDLSVSDIPSLKGVDSKVCTRLHPQQSQSLKSKHPLGMSEILENYLTQFVKFFIDRYVLIGRPKVK